MTNRSSRSPKQSRRDLSEGLAFYHPRFPVYVGCTRSLEEAISASKDSDLVRNSAAVCRGDLCAAAHSCRRRKA
jgi:hypothetical protein